MAPLAPRVGAFAGFALGGVIIAQAGDLLGEDRSSLALGLAADRLAGRGRLLTLGGPGVRRHSSP